MRLMRALSTRPIAIITNTGFAGCGLISLGHGKVSESNRLCVARSPGLAAWAKRPGKVERLPGLFAQAARPGEQGNT